MTDSASLTGNVAGDLEVLSFGLGGETLAIPAAMVQEIIDLLPETAVPGADPLVGHVINYRGRVIPLADLRTAFGMAPAPPTRDSRIIVIEQALGDDATELIGLRADTVNEVTILSAASREPPPVIGLRWRREHVSGLVQHRDQIVVLPDLAAIFAPLR
ncbi:chemotaxis protein CheW [Sphingomonas yunnanensis]|uniref:chemotaxis protein CheW n=1 Tax=Sphingomonas yunnanensis TaxID=310400 RepID=UPI001CA7722B|nr:chemotaxis protein CheW [Sphingomonas yunnanensis]MBY9062041.1 chemotaxis protein CheW [Sphingomonas yunnanensis]